MCEVSSDKIVSGGMVKELKMNLIFYRGSVNAQDVTESNRPAVE